MAKLKTILKQFILSVQFFTRIPINTSFNVVDQDFGKLMGLLPIVGLLIGSILYLAFIVLFHFLTGYILSTILLIIYIALTGGLHIDGLGDTFDGLYSNKPREKILEIMKDSRMGTYGILAIFFSCILNIFLIKELIYFAPVLLILYPVTGRMAGLICASISNYARDNGGLAKNFVTYCNSKELFCGLVLFFIIFIFFSKIILLIISLIIIIWSFLLTKYFSSKINGVTGDIIGALIEVTQIFFLILTYLILIK